MKIKNGSWKNKLYFGDNLDILRDKIKDESVDLIYIDPPFQSGRNYNQIFQAEQGEAKGATAQIKAFEDTWKWSNEAQDNYEGLITGEINKEKANQKLIDLIKSMRSYLGEVPMMAYLAMMAPRLLEMKRTLKETGSIFLHCDPTASHYLKLLMDSIFGVDNFRNEIIWKKNSGGIGRTAFNKRHDTIFFYSKTDKYLYDGKAVGDLREQNEGTFGGYFGIDKDGRKYREVRKAGKVYKYYMDEPKNPDDVWTIPQIPERDKTERVGYPTQKPELLLERIINATTKKNDLVLDAFCGCGTTVAVAQRLKRRWIGIDITYLSIDVIATRLEKNGFKKEIDFKVEGEPKDVYSAEKLAKQNPFQFEIWCISKLNATPSPRQTGDEGVDGTINFVDLFKENKIGKGVVQVKGTQTVNPAMVRDLKGTIKSQSADFGILITLKKPTQGMIKEATKSGYYGFRYTKESVHQKIPFVQFLTVADLFKKPLPILLPPIIDSHKNPTITKENEQVGLF